MDFNAWKIMKISNDINFLKTYSQFNSEDIRGNLTVSYENIHVNDFISLKKSKTKKNVLRGLHIQSPKSPQRKIISVIEGELIDILLNLDPSDDNFGNITYFHLSAHNNLAVEIPCNFAHGFITYTETIFQYMCIGKYSTDNELTIKPSEELLSKLGFDYNKIILSEKDTCGISIPEGIEIAKTFKW